MNSSFLFGMRIVSHELARDRRTLFQVTPWGARKKKRKGWRVTEVTIDRPACFKVGDTLYMHPELIAKLPKAPYAA